jgi:hypothetical protein
MDNIKMSRRETKYEDVSWSNLSKDRDKRQFSKLVCKSSVSTGGGGFWIAERLLASQKGFHSV